MSIAFRYPARHQQTGIVLIEALVSILIFSVGVLSIIALLAYSITSSRDSTNRSEAGLLANQIIGQMWADDRDPTHLQTVYGTGGTGYTAWLNSNAFQNLPNVATYPPTITVAAASAVTTPPSSVVTVTIKWKPPDEASSALPHQYIAVTQIN
ncbi:MAG: hypothetical protein WDM70_05730 [Nitrosomonadales bacterium]